MQFTFSICARCVAPPCRVFGRRARSAAHHNCRVEIPFLRSPGNKALCQPVERLSFTKLTGTTWFNGSFPPDTHTASLLSSSILGTEDPFSNRDVTEKEGKGSLRLAKTPVREQAAVFFRPYRSSCFWTLLLVIRIPEFCVPEMSTSISSLTEHCHQESNVWFSNYELLLASQTFFPCSIWLTTHKFKHSQCKKHGLF